MQQLPSGVVHGERVGLQPFQQAADAAGNEPGDAVRVGRVPGQPHEVRLLGVRQLQRPAQRGADLGGRIGRASLLEPDDVFDRDAGEDGQFLAAQARSTAGRLVGDPHARGFEAIAPCPQCPPEIIHAAIVRSAHLDRGGTGCTRTCRGCLSPGPRRRVRP
ncbi:hypothetical protein DV20_03170 [Amycolatopsis rifamycinica]|uniref:Uncharacterized protein n=1 Tax=Amycolatopsis rifamycinica TaxID=287986 RepID=A0A066UD05_9PSEU|nr:hypothetical protein DV20_03170 [Amycolatopsis rifamycinica]